MVVIFKTNIVTKFTAYVAWILLCESCKFGEKICYSNWDNICFLMDCFLLAHPVHFISHLTCTNVWGYKASVYQYADEILSLFTCIWKVPTELPSDAVTYRTCHHSDSSLRDKVLMPYFTFIMHTHTHTHMQMHEQPKRMHGNVWSLSLTFSCSTKTQFQENEQMCMTIFSWNHIYVFFVFCISIIIIFLIQCSLNVNLLD